MRATSHAASSSDGVPTDPVFSPAVALETARPRFAGSKSQSGVYQRVINLIPPHETYIEPFYGLGAIARLKRPAAVTYGVDLAAPAVAVPPWVTFVHGCGLQFLETYAWRGGEFVYGDPPYLLGERRMRRYYAHEMPDEDHERLLSIAKQLPCPVLLSGYPSRLYDRALKDWNREEFQVMTRGHRWATEVLWFNYDRPAVLHDVSYVGTNYRERLRIKRKRARWKNRLERLPELERAALFSALVEVMGDAAAARVISDATAGWLTES